LNPEHLNVERRVTRAAIIAEARSWIGTPWKHQGRLKGVACDCVGFAIEVPKAVGMWPAEFQITGYSRWPDPALMKKYLDKYLDPIAPSEMKGADVLWLKPHRIPQHVAIYTFEHTIIHAIDRIRGVREHRYVDEWFAAAYRYRGIE
jgi:cell wall-associated NlpC family hydrolase